MSINRRTFRDLQEQIANITSQPDVLLSEAMAPQGATAKGWKKHMQGDTNSFRIGLEVGQSGSGDDQTGISLEAMTKTEGKNVRWEIKSFAYAGDVETGGVGVRGTAPSLKDAIVACEKAIDTVLAKALQKGKDEIEGFATPARVKAVKDWKSGK